MSSTCSLQLFQEKCYANNFINDTSGHFYLKTIWKPSQSIFGAKQPMLPRSSHCSKPECNGAIIITIFIVSMTNTNSTMSEAATLPGKRIPNVCQDTAVKQDVTRLYAIGKSSEPPPFVNAPESISPSSVPSNNVIHEAVSKPSPSPPPPSPSPLTLATPATTATVSSSTPTTTAATTDTSSSSSSFTSFHPPSSAKSRPKNRIVKSKESTDTTHHGSEADRIYYESQPGYPKVLVKHRERFVECQIKKKKRAPTSLIKCSNCGRSCKHATFRRRQCMNKNCIKELKELKAHARKQQEKKMSELNQAHDKKKASNPTYLQPNPNTEKEPARAAVEFTIIKSEKRIAHAIPPSRIRFIRRKLEKSSRKPYKRNWQPANVRDSIPEAQELVFHYCCVSSDNILKPEHVNIVESTNANVIAPSSLEASGPESNLSPSETAVADSVEPVVDAPVDAANVPDSHVEAIPARLTVIEDSSSGTGEPLEYASSAPVQDAIHDEVEVTDSSSVSSDSGILLSVSSEVLDHSAESSTLSSISESTCKLAGNWVPFSDSRYPNVQSVRRSSRTNPNRSTNAVSVVADSSDTLAVVETDVEARSRSVEPTSVSRSSVEVTSSSPPVRRLRVPGVSYVSESMANDHLGSFWVPVCHPDVAAVRRSSRIASLAPVNYRV